MGRTIKVTILDTGQLNIVPQQAFSGENNAVILDCYCSDALKDYTKYIDFESNGVKYRSPAFTDGSANFVFNVPNIISNYNTKFQFIFISGETIIKTQIGNIYVQDSVNAADQITFESGDILDDFEQRITIVEGKVDDFLTDFSIDVGTVETLPAGSDATVEKTGTNIDPVFNFGIPKGDKGDKGDTGDNLTFGTPWTTTLPLTPVLNVLYPFSGTNATLISGITWYNGDYAQNNGSSWVRIPFQSLSNYYTKDQNKKNEKIYYDAGVLQAGSGIIPPNTEYYTPNLTPTEYGYLKEIRIRTSQSGTAVINVIEAIEVVSPTAKKFNFIRTFNITVISGDNTIDVSTLNIFMKPNYYLQLASGDVTTVYGNSSTQGWFTGAVTFRGKQLNLTGSGTNSLEFYYLTTRLSELDDYVKQYNIAPSNVVTVATTTYNSIRNAITAITDASYKKKYVVYVPNGSYSEIDIVGKDYITVLGQSTKGVILTCNGQSGETTPADYYYSAEANKVISTVNLIYKHLFFITKYFTVKNITGIAIGCKYIIHQDKQFAIYESNVIDCDLKEEGCNNAVGLGIWENQKINYIRCNFLRAYNAANFGGVSAIYCHNSANQTAAANLNVEDCYFENCHYGSIEELASTQDDLVIFKNCLSNNPMAQIYHFAASPGTAYNIQLRMVSTPCNWVRLVNRDYRKVYANYKFKAHNLDGTAILAGQIIGLDNVFYSMPRVSKAITLQNVIAIDAADADSDLNCFGRGKVGYALATGNATRGMTMFKRSGNELIITTNDNEAIAIAMETKNVTNQLLLIYLL